METVPKKGTLVEKCMVAKYDNEIINPFFSLLEYIHSTFLWYLSGASIFFRNAFGRELLVHLLLKGLWLISCNRSQQGSLRSQRQSTWKNNLKTAKVSKNSQPISAKNVIGNEVVQGPRWNKKGKRTAKIAQNLQPISMEYNCNQFKEKCCINETCSWHLKMTRNVSICHQYS